MDFHKIPIGILELTFFEKCEVSIFMKIGMRLFINDFLFFSLIVNLIIIWKARGNFYCSFVKFYL
jgi:hypothetical protein